MLKELITRVWLPFTVAALVLLNGLSPSPVYGQQTESVQAWIEQMSPRERIAQLMIVPMTGSSEAEISALNALITTYGIGGVTAQGTPQNGTDAMTAVQLREALNRLQGASLASRPTDRSGLPLLTIVPLFTDDGSVLRLVSDSAPLASAMATGAAWQPEQAARLGELVGQQAQSLGINLVLGPTLSMFNPELQNPSLIAGTQSYGSHSYWIGQFAEQFVRGVRAGSRQRSASILAQFPGVSSSDRRIDEEIPVLPASLETLTSRDFAPYLYTLGLRAAGDLLVSGVQCTNIRFYTGPGTVGQPVCLDEAAFLSLLSQDEFASWRLQGGLVVSPSLGSQAIRRWYAGATFPHRQIARDALLAGSDLLMLQSFGPTLEAESSNNIVDTIEFLTELYLTDENFSSRVDESLVRVLSFKNELYSGDFSLANVLVPDEEAEETSSVTADIARSAVTLIAPVQQQVPPAPDLQADILIVTEQTPVQPCSTCMPEAPLSSTDIQVAINSLYGASGQVNPDRVRSYTLNQLAVTLNLPVTLADPNEVPAFDAEQRLRLTREMANSEYMIFAIYTQTGAQALQAYLGTRVNVPGQNIVVMDFGVPYFLTATDISKLAAYYALYSPVSPFVDSAVRALFNEADLQGKPPISIPGISYDIGRVTQPDPAQVITLRINQQSYGQSEQLGDFSLGEVLNITTAPLLDLNNHVVPDGIPVQLEFTVASENVRFQSTTRNGRADFQLTADHEGTFTLTLSSGDARGNYAGRVVEIIATSEPSGTQQSSETVIASPDARTADRVQLTDLLITLSVVGLLSGLIYAAARLETRSHDAALRLVLGTIIGGFLTYIYFGLNLPGADLVAPILPQRGVIVLALLGSMTGLTYTWWSTLKTRR